MNWSSQLNMMGRHQKRLLSFVVLSSCLSLFILIQSFGYAQTNTPTPNGLTATTEESQLFELLEEENYARVRTLGAALLRRDPNSYVAHLALAMVQFEAEANFPVALYHAREAKKLYEQRHGNPPQPGSPWQWHARMLLTLAEIEGAVGHPGERIVYLDEFNRFYQPKRFAERAWSYMKMGRFDDARRAAREAIATGDQAQISIGYNALCAIEFEAGENGRSYEACKRALEIGRASPEGPQVVDITNFAEAARTELKLEEAERLLLEATELSGEQGVGYGNPWLELGELYIREGRFAEALDALKKVPAYRMRRPPSMRESDHNEARRALSELFLTLGRPEEAIKITERAMVAPDRRSHNSRDDAQDKAIVALVDRATRLDLAEAKVERAVALPFHARVRASLEAALLRFEAWQSGRRIVTLLSSGGRLSGLFAIGTSKGGITPPWLIGDLVKVLGPGPVRAAIAEARNNDRRALAAGYYDAFEAEAAFEAGDETKAKTYVRRALDRLPHEEVTLMTRMRAILAEIDLEQGRSPGVAFSPVFERDPSLFRRRDIVLPVHIVVNGDATATRIETAIKRSPRFGNEDDSDITLRINASGGQARICLSGARGESFGCADTRSRGSVNDQFIQRVVDEFHQIVFSPRVNLSQADIASLDGSPRSARDPLRGLSDAENP